MATTVNNILEIVGTKKQVMNVRNYITGSPDNNGNPMYIDFNKVKKIPEELEIEICEDAKNAQRLLFGEEGVERGTHISLEDAQKKFDNLEEDLQKKSVLLALKYNANYKKFGCATSFSWCCKNWDTNHNAHFQILEEENKICFTTSWRDVGHLICVLSEKFPEVVFKYEMLSEDGEQGHAIYKNGEMLERL